MMMNDFCKKILEKSKNIDISSKRVKIIALTAVVVVLSSISLKIYFNHYKNVNSEIKKLNSVNVVNPNKLREENIKETINTLEPFENRLIKTAAGKKNLTDNFNETKKYSQNLTSTIKDTSKDLDQLKKCSVPPEVNNYKSNLINEYTNFIDGLDHEIKYVNSSNCSQDEMSAAQSNYNNFISIKNANEVELNNLIKSLKNK